MKWGALIIAGLIFSAYFLTFSSIDNNAYATSGACSWHGGVSCSAGSDWDGSVICNDGWRDSSVSYYSMSMCNSYSLPNISTTPECPYFSNYSYLTDQCECMSGYIVSGNSCTSGTLACRDMYGVNADYDLLDNTCKCRSGYVFDSNQKCVTKGNSCRDLYGDNSYYNSLSDTCTCLSGHHFGTNNQCVSDGYSGSSESSIYDNYSYQDTTNTTSTCPSNAYLATDATCYCNNGYTPNKDLDGCIAMDKSCKDSYGSHIKYNELLDTCTCDDGYLFDDENQKCLKQDSWCKEQFGSNIYYDDKIKDCTCSDGYWFDEEDQKCIKADAWCENTYGKHHEANELTNTCDCADGYWFSFAQDTCIATQDWCTETWGTKSFYDEKQDECLDQDGNILYEEEEIESIFEDLANDHDNKDAIMYLVNEGVVKGYEDGTFKPENPINRAELLKVLVEGKGLEVSIDDYSDCFTDVTYQWFAPYVCYAKDMGWVEGYEDNTFKPDQTVNKVEAIKMLLNSQGVDIPETVDGLPFEDMNTEDWFVPYLIKAKDLGILEEEGDMFKGGEGMKRGGICENLYRLIEYND